MYTRPYTIGNSWEIIGHYHENEMHFKNSMSILVKKCTTNTMDVLYIMYNNIKANICQKGFNDSLKIYRRNNNYRNELNTNLFLI